MFVEVTFSESQLGAFQKCPYSIVDCPGYTWLPAGECRGSRMESGQLGSASTGRMWCLRQSKIFFYYYFYFLYSQLWLLAGEGQGHAGVGGQGASGGVEVDVVPSLVAADGGRGVG